MDDGWPQQDVEYTVTLHYVQRDEAIGPMSKARAESFIEWYDDPNNKAVMSWDDFGSMYSSNDVRTRRHRFGKTGLMYITVTEREVKKPGLFR